MLALRLLIGLAGIALVICLLGYAVSRDRRWLRNAGFVLKAGVAIVALVLIVQFLGRLARLI